MGRVKAWAFNVYVALNMLLCAVFGLGRSLPRETISGYIGRKHADGLTAGVVDRLYFWEPDHCQVTAEQEAEARKALHYPCSR